MMKKTLAFEIGTEEIPAFDLVFATKQLKTLMEASLEEAHIPHESITAYSTPRRLLAYVSGIPSHSLALVEEYKGPSVALAFDEKGIPSKAALGFARGKGLAVESLERREVGGTEYVYAVKHIEAQAVETILSELLEGIIRSISWPKSCRWGTESEYFSRPVRWIVALLGSEVLPVSFAGLVASNTTRGHRFMAPGEHAVASSDDLLDVLARAFVIPSSEQREEIIRSGIAAIEKTTGTFAELPEKTLTEVINLTEYPTPLVGSFDEAFLEVPDEIVVDAMLMHQRYFPLYDENHQLTNKFITVSNGNPACADIIVDGNERVVRPRLSDAKFFYEEDLKYPLAAFVNKLETVVFQETLGSMLDKTERIVALAASLAQEARLNKTDTCDAERAAYLCKADLVSNAVVEFTSVQGIMGSYYAKASGETDQVAEAIADHYRPRFAGDEVPRSTVGKLVAVADKLDTITGLFAVGQGPTGSSDPFALRRSAIGIINMLAKGLPISLNQALDASLATYATLIFERQVVRNEIIDFFVTRTKVMLRDAGHAADVVDAVLASTLIEPAEIIARVEALTDARNTMTDTMDDLATAYARANNLRDTSLGMSVDESLMVEAEHLLFGTIRTVERAVSADLSRNDYAQALCSLAALRGPIDTFFEDVMIMVEDQVLKENRLKLLNRFVAVFTNLADFGKMAKSGK